MIDNGSDNGSDNAGDNGSDDTEEREDSDITTQDKIQAQKGQNDVTVGMFLLDHI